MTDLLAIFDIDDTISNTIALDWPDADDPDYEEAPLSFAEQLLLSAHPHPRLAALARSYVANPRVFTAFISARSDGARDVTVDWLQYNLGSAATNPPRSGLWLTHDMPIGWLYGKLKSAVMLAERLQPARIEAYEDDTSVLDVYRALFVYCDDVKLYRCVNGRADLFDTNRPERS